MNRFTGLFILAVLAIIAIPSCDYESEEDLFMPPPPPDSASWAADIEPIISLNCAYSGCHNSTDQSPPLTTYAEVSANADLILVEVVVDKTMPSGGPPLPKSERDKIQLWIEQGALNN